MTGVSTALVVFVFICLVIYVLPVVPTFEDESMLPEVTAFILESYRWRPVTPGGMFSRLTSWCCKRILVLGQVFLIAPQKTLFG